MMEKQLGKEGMHVEVWLQREGKLECGGECTARQILVLEMHVF